VIRTLLALTAVGGIAAAIALAAQPRTEPRPPRPPQPAVTPAPSPSAEPTPTPPRLERAQINRQDRSSRRHRAREAQVFDARPLLERLPVTQAEVRIDIGGLAADDRTTVLAIDPGRTSRAHARTIYAAALRRTRDPGTAYALEWAR
jgi:hypothetical protein